MRIKQEPLADSHDTLHSTPEQCSFDTAAVKTEKLATELRGKVPKKESVVKAEVKMEAPAEVSPAKEGQQHISSLAQRAHALLVQEYGLPSRGNTSGVDAGDGCGAVKTSVLDSLVRTILSQNTTDATSAVAFANLKAALPTWKQVLEAEEGVAEEAVRCGGLADIKMARIRTILEKILADHPEAGDEPSLEFLHSWPTELVKKYLLGFKGVGPKTVSCVLMFTMERPEFPVDTHVWKLAIKLGWVPKAATREMTYVMLNQVVPDQIKFDLHVLLVQHGKALKNELGVIKPAVNHSKALRLDDDVKKPPSKRPKKVKKQKTT